MGGIIARHTSFNKDLAMAYAKILINLITKRAH
jgi:hypothetical protein